MLSRRNFFKGTLATVSLATIPSLMPTRANAWVVTAVIAVASLAVSLMSRGKKARAAALVAQANLQILTSISKEVGAINVGLQQALVELNEIRKLVSKVPQETVALSNHNEMAGLWRRYREKLTSFLDPANTDTTSENYYTFLKSLYESYALARSRLIEITPETAYDYAIHVAVAQEHEMMIALELVSDEAREVGISFDLTEVKVALRDSYLPFLRNAVDPKLPNSIPATITSLERAIVDFRDQQAKNPVGKFFLDGKTGGMVCKKTTTSDFRVDPFSCPYLIDDGGDNGCKTTLVREHTLTPLILEKTEEIISENRSLTSSSISRGKPYQYAAEAENIVLNKHKIHNKICDGNIDSKLFDDAEKKLFSDWKSIEKEIDARELAIESLVHAKRVCELTINNAECRIILLETGENTCGL
ncbi:hypothetical protein [Lentilitoribacter sp. Alg239-R112]|uniref:hypothetical protein n=1 Tax=Lentilitoribacter sp. Alg239-R112 TaxID=2305987 RepID=UPI0013A6DA4A|nr:hypothetical protein [Lentilitoribacter sp. Alg239-R112]